MDDYDDYDDEGHISAGDDSDDEEVKFVSSKRRFKYTTFGNEGRANDDDIDGKEASLYGVFAEAPARRRNQDTPSSTPMFVKGATKPVEKENEEEIELELKPATKPDATPISATEDEKDTNMNKEAEEAMRKQQEEANQKFLALLGRGRGQKRPRRSFESERRDGPTEFKKQQQSNGLGFRASAGVELGRGNSPGFHSETGGGLGFQSSGGGGGLGFKSASAQEEDAPQFGGLGSTSMNFFGEQPPPPPPIKKDPNLGKWERHTKGIGMKLLAKMGYQGSGGLGAKRKKLNISGKEAITKGGISRPVEVVVRPSNLGLGFGNFKEATKLKSNQQLEAEIQGKEIPKKKEKNAQDQMGGPARESSSLPTTDELMVEQSWKRGAKQASSQKKQRRTVVPYTELLEKQKQPAIIDMRGPSATTDERGEIPLAAELLHNTSILMNTYENKLHSTSHFLQTSKQKLQSLQSDLDNMERRKKEGAKRISKLQGVLQVVNNIDDILKNSDSNVVDVTSKVQAMVEGLRDELTVEDRDSLQFDQVLVPSLLSPLITSKLDQWEPLQDGSKKAETVIASLLSLGSGIDEAEVVQERKLSILSRDILPKVKAAYESTKWNPLRDVERGVALYETFLKSVETHEALKKESHDDGNVFPAGDVDNTSLSDLLNRQLLRQTIFPKLMRVLSQWKAELDRTGNCIEDGLESWLLPWMPHLDHPAILTQLTTDLKRKVRSALSCLSRGVNRTREFLSSSIATLRPWRTLLRKDTISDLTSKYIAPRLMKSFSRLSIAMDPTEQEWFTVDSLMDLYNTRLMSQLEFISILEGEVLGAWAQELYRQLTTNPQHNVEVLGTVYSAWKRRIFGPSTSVCNQLIRNDETICRVFYSCLRMIEVAMTNKPEALVSMDPRTSSFRDVLARRSKEERNSSEEQLDRLQAKDAVEFRRRVMSRQVGGTTTFREVVEDFAREQDISFRPRTTGKNTTDDGKPIFLFGSIPIYLDANVIFALQDSRWQPLAIENLSTIARNQ